MRIALFKRGGDPVEDPVCHMDVDIGNPLGGKLEYQGTSYYFCGLGCNRAFLREPEVYLSGDKKVQM